MGEVTIRVEASGENLTRVTAELLALLTTAAGPDARRVDAPVDGTARSGPGISFDEFLRIGVPEGTAGAVSSVLATWARSSKRRLTLTSGDDQLVVDGTAAQDVLERWLSGRG